MPEDSSTTFHALSLYLSGGSLVLEDAMKLMMECSSV